MNAQQLVPAYIPPQSEPLPVCDTLQKYVNVLSTRQSEALKNLYYVDKLGDCHAHIAKAVGIPKRTWYDWLCASTFRSALSDVFTDLSIYHLPLARETLRGGLKKGNYNFLRLFHELRGDLQPEGSHKTAIQVNVFSEGQQAVIREMAGKLADVA